jgi:hypothetical protein
MGYTGKKAMQFKIAYIEAFNKMEAQLKAPFKPSLPSPWQYEEKATETQRYHLRKLMKKLAAIDGIRPIEVKRIILAYLKDQRSHDDDTFPPKDLTIDDLTLGDIQVACWLCLCKIDYLQAKKEANTPQGWNGWSLVWRRPQYPADFMPNIQDRGGDAPADIKTAIHIAQALRCWGDGLPDDVRKDFELATRDLMMVLDGEYKKAGEVDSALAFARIRLNHRVGQGVRQ